MVQLALNVQLLRHHSLMKERVRGEGVFQEDLCVDEGDPCAGERDSSAVKCFPYLAILFVFKRRYSH